MADDDEKESRVIPIHYHVQNAGKQIRHALTLPDADGESIVTIKRLRYWVTSSIKNILIYISSHGKTITDTDIYFVVRLAVPAQQPTIAPSDLHHRPASGTQSHNRCPLQ